MSFVDKVVAAVTPPESEKSRREARAKARVAATSDWLSLILDHHLQIEEAFAAVKAAQGTVTRTSALKSLALVLTGHSNAEESVIYPALVHFGHKSHAMSGYTEQAGAKAEMGQLQYLDPASMQFQGTSSTIGCPPSNRPR